MYKLHAIKVEMPNENTLVEDVKTRWNSTYDLIEAAYEKSKD